jgi:adenylosuccinate lyase
MNMATTTKFVGDFRGQIAAMIHAMDQAESLSNFCTRMGWVEEDFESVLQGTDITAAEFFAAVTMLTTFRTNFSATIAMLSKLL